MLEGGLIFFVGSPSPDPTKEKYLCVLCVSVVN
jgi:hypothetical protein